MPINIPDSLPAKKILEQEKYLCDVYHSCFKSNIRPLKLLIVNIMPTKIITETQLLRVLSNTPLQIDIELLHMKSHQSKNVSMAHLETFYTTFDQIRNKKYDGMIVTGAPVEKMAFEEVDYWEELTQIFDWSTTHVFSSMYICWASQAALYYFYQIEKENLSKKISGIYLHQINKEKRNRKILRGFDNQFYAPHSRHSEINREQLQHCQQLDILASSLQAGPYLIANQNGTQFFITGHPEYDVDTLHNEYIRDLSLNLNPHIPINYYLDDIPENDIVVRWRSHAYLLFSNWLNYYVYQLTLYDLYKTSF